MSDGHSTPPSLADGSGRSQSPSDAVLPPRPAKRARLDLDPYSQQYSHHQQQSASTTSPAAPSAPDHHDPQAQRERHRLQPPTHAQQQQRQQKEEDNGLPPTIFGPDPLVPDIHRAVLDFVYAELHSARALGLLASHKGAVLEVEAKLGRLLDMSSSGSGPNAPRLSLPVTCETPIVSGPGAGPGGLRVRFEATMPAAQHAHYNRMLNKLVEQRRLKYTHLVQTDRFYAGSSSGDRVRESYDPRLAARHPGGPAACVTARICKHKLAHLDVHVPRAPFDYRVTVAIEVPIDEAPPPGAKPEPDERVKDRITYTHACVQVDLTKVTSTGTGAVTHELEIEFCDSAASVTDEVQRLDAGQPNRFRGNMVHLINNVRYLAGIALPI
ncbi:CYTH-like domain-containing protein [Blastocladiella britannica]|nr:CYTH-like domain-containing protein [Blastocladiella britannica]